MNETANRRAYTRVRIVVDVEVGAPGQAKISGRGRDLSVKGLYLMTPKTLPPGTTCRLNLLLTGTATPVAVQITGRVVYADDAGMGFEFVGVDAESFVHLRNLVLYNSMDPEQVEREFQNQLGVKRRPDP